MAATVPVLEWRHRGAVRRPFDRVDLSGHPNPRMELSPAQKLQSFRFHP